MTYNNNEIDLNDANKKITKLPATVKLNGYSFTISENGDVSKIQWIDNNNGSYTNAETGQTLTVGDTVKYETILNKIENEVNSTKLNTLVEHLNEYSGVNPSTDNANINRDALGWNILDIKDGNIRLISSNPTSKNIKFHGSNGYNNAVYLLDEACNVLYSSNIGKAQNLKIEDIIEKTNYNYTQYSSSNWALKKYGETKEYTSNFTYPNIYINEFGCKAISATENTGTSLGLSQQSTFVKGKTLATDILTVTQTYWGKAMATTDFNISNYYNLFINKGTNYPKYWLSSRCVICDQDYSRFAIREVNDGIVGRLDLFLSNNTAPYSEDGVVHKFRPVVTLNSNVQLKPDGTNTWKIK